MSWDALFDGSNAHLLEPDLTMTTVIVEKPRSRRIETRTKGKRKMKRLACEMSEQIQRQIRQTEWEIFAYTARGLYP